ncbi:MAG: dihydropteroate synthase [bacterium]
MTMSAAQTVTGRIITWRCRARVFECGSIPLVMGILNVTPDSFSDGNSYFDAGSALARGLQMMDEGADIIDVGGESTRPGAETVTVEEEKRRVIPVIEELCRRLGQCGETGPVVSIDTSKAEVARLAIEAGASIINDVSALTGDSRMADIARESGAGVILMHMQGSPRSMQDKPQYGDVTADVSKYLVSRVLDLAGHGVEAEQIAVDPGIGFGKTVRHNLELLRHLDLLRSACGRPVVVGLSRKSFLGKLTGRDVGERLIPGIAGLSFCVTKGADVMRVHDVRDSVDAINVMTALMNGSRE